MRNAGEISENNQMYRPRVNVIVGMPPREERSDNIRSNTENHNYRRMEFSNLKICNRVNSIEFNGKTNKIVYYADSGTQTNYDYRYEINIKEISFSILPKIIIKKKSIKDKITVESKPRILENTMKKIPITKRIESTTVKIANGKIKFTKIPVNTKTILSK
jgi:hypothetical protein